jgi:UDP-glucose 4-epimerase
MSNCLVIGANGFIGSYLVDALVQAGHSVTAFDRFSSGAVSYQALGVRAVVGDFLNTADIAAALDGQQYVFHFLSATSPATSDDDPTLDIRTNISQSVELFKLCVASGVERVYFASTGGAIYGDQGLDRYRETDLALPVSPYGIGKLALEHYLRYFRAKHGLDSVSLRISNPYGPRQHPHRKQGLVPIALRQIANDEPVVRFGGGTMVRDYIFVEDVARMIAGMAGRDTLYDVYNIGSGTGHTVNDVLSELEYVTARKINLRHLPTPSTFVEKVVLDTGRFESEFGPSVFSGLRDGIAATWAEVELA